jgi:hypothetical protein
MAPACGRNASLFRWFSAMSFLQDDVDQENPMQKYIVPIVAAVGLSIATPALAYDSAGLMSMQAALGVATDMGIATVSHTEFAGDEWQIAGRDVSGRYMEVDVDAATGQVLNVDR